MPTEGDCLLPVAVIYALIQSYYPTLEYAAIEINTNNCGKVLLAIFYRPPSANTTWIHNFIKIVNNCAYNKIVILGDFNFPSIHTWIEGSGFCETTDSALFTFCQTL